MSWTTPDQPDVVDEVVDGLGDDAGDGQGDDAGGGPGDDEGHGLADHRGLGRAHAHAAATTRRRLRWYVVAAVAVVVAGNVLMRLLQTQFDLGPAWDDLPVFAWAIVVGTGLVLITRAYLRRR